MNDNSNIWKFSGGFAEIVPEPTPLTYSFIRYWFTGKRSLGTAMRLLGLPYEATGYPLLEMNGSELVVDLLAEEKILYSHTIFCYKNHENLQDIPQLGICYPKVFNPSCWNGTLRILFRQSSWIAHPDAVQKQCRHWIDEMPENVTVTHIKDLEEILIRHVWPVVLAVGFLTEFYSQYLFHEAKQEYPSVIAYISRYISEHDWFFLSLTTQEKVKKKELSFSFYLHQYGLRSDVDYELASPRWHEIPEEMKKRIASFVPVRIKKTPLHTFSKNLEPLVKTVIALELLRTDAKHKALIIYDALRQALRKKYPQENLATLTRRFIYEGIEDTSISVLQPRQIAIPRRSFGKGIPVSPGIVTGKALHIRTNDSNVAKNTIGIFPNASPQFALQFPKCAGIIFLKGGQTSHGAIVAREFGIPALIDMTAENIKNGAEVTINGTTALWQET